MCIAILQKPGTELTNAQLCKGWNVNRDGGGFAYVNKQGKLVIDRGYMAYDPFAKAYEHALNDRADDSPMLVHMRIKTSGLINEKNTHPFLITPQGGPKCAMIHNGVLFHPTGKLAGPANDPRSDTRVVAECLNNILRLQDVKDASIGIGQAIGRHNKMAFLYENKEYVIINEDEGYWDKDIWFSNYGCRVYGT